MGSRCKVNPFTVVYRPETAPLQIIDQIERVVTRLRHCLPGGRHRISARDLTSKMRKQSCSVLVILAPVQGVDHTWSIFVVLGWFDRFKYRHDSLRSRSQSGIYGVWMIRTGPPSSLWLTIKVGKFSPVERAFQFVGKVGKFWLQPIFDGR
jgi:hypothetical protein